MLRPDLLTYLCLSSATLSAAVAWICVRRRGNALVNRVLSRRGPMASVPAARAGVLERISDAVVVVAPDGRLLDLNAAGERLIRQLVPRAPRDLIGAPVRPLLGARLPEDGLTSGEYEIDVDGRDVTFDVRVTHLTDRRGRPTGRAFVVRDITELAERQRALATAQAQLAQHGELIDQLRRELAKQAAHDPLTGLYNRRHLVDQLAEDVAKARVRGQMSVVMIDIDHFKSVNGRYGHDAGDRLLTTVATALSALVRSGDTLARYSGGEFVAVLPNATSDQARVRGEQLRTCCEAVAVTTEDGPVSRTVSVGIATYPAAGRTPSALLSAADQALRAAKTAGRNRVMVAERVSPQF